MLTTIGLFCVLLVLAFIMAVIAGAISLSPIVLTIIGMLLIDYFVFKLIFGRKKKKKK